MAERLEKPKTEIRETKTRVKRRKRENEGQSWRLKKELRRKGFESLNGLMALSRSWALLSGTCTWWSRWSCTSLWSEKRKDGSSWNSVKLCCLFGRDQSNAPDCGWHGLVSELMGGLEVKIERLPGLDEDEKLAEFISVATRKDWSLWRWWTFGESLGCLFGLIMRMSLLIDVTSVISRCLLRCSAERLDCWLKSLDLRLVW